MIWRPLKVLIILNALLYLWHMGSKHCFQAVFVPPKQRYCILHIYQYAILYIKQKKTKHVALRVTQKLDIVTCFPKGESRGAQTATISVHTLFSETNKEFLKLIYQTIHQLVCGFQQDASLVPS